ncbi:MAG: MFS transporter [Dehalococcoidia bacterium]
MSPQRAGLRRRHGFTRLWAAQTISLLGSGMGALPFTALLILRASPLDMGLLGAATRAPGLVAAPLAGVWVDRLPRRPLMVAADLGRAALLLSVPAVATFGLLRLEQLYAVAFLSGALDAVAELAAVAYLPALVDREDLVEANGRLAAGAAVAEAGSFSVGGWVVQAVGALAATVIDAVTFLASAALLLSIRAPEPAPSPETREPLWRDVTAGLRTVAQRPLLRVLAIGAVALALGRGAIGAVILLYGARDLGLSPGVLGLIFAVGGGASLVAALAAGAVARRLGPGPTLVLTALVATAGAACLPLAGGPTAVAVALLVLSQVVNDPAVAIYEVNEVSLRQALTPDRLLGRVNGAVRFAGLLALLAGSLLGGLVGQAAGPRAALTVGVGLGSLQVVALALSPVRSLRSRPDAGP